VRTLKQSCSRNRPSDLGIQIGNIERAHFTSDPIVPWVARKSFSRASQLRDTPVGIMVAKRVEDIFLRNSTSYRDFLGERSTTNKLRRAGDGCKIPRREYHARIETFCRFNKRRTNWDSVRYLVNHASRRCQVARNGILPEMNVAQN